MLSVVVVAAAAVAVVGAAVVGAAVVVVAAAAAAAALFVKRYAIYQLCRLFMSLFSVRGSGLAGAHGPLSEHEDGGPVALKTICSV